MTLKRDRLGSSLSSYFVVLLICYPARPELRLQRFKVVLSRLEAHVDGRSGHSAKHYSV